MDEVATEQQRWLKIFVEGETLDDVNLPEWMQTPEMRKAMKVLHDFSEKEENYHIYASRLDYQRVQWSREHTLEKMRSERDLAQLNLANAENRASQAEQRIQALQAEIERLKSA